MYTKGFIVSTPTKVKFDWHTSIQLHYHHSRAIKDWTRGLEDADTRVYFAEGAT